VVLAT